MIIWLQILNSNLVESKSLIMHAYVHIPAIVLRKSAHGRSTFTSLPRGGSCVSAFNHKTNAPITVMPHPPRLVVGGDFEGGLTSVACPLGGAFALYEFFCTCTHAVLISLVPMQALSPKNDEETAPVVGNQIFKTPPPSTNLRGWGITEIAA